MAPATLHLLAGPTAVGKTEAALAWAEARGAEILSCDALCVYRGMNLGTAKPDASARARVPHHGLDLAPPDQVFSVAAYVAEARRVAAEVTGRGRPLLVVGGSGFYLRAFFAPVADEWEITPELRRPIAELERTEGLAGLLRALDRLNPEGTGALDRHNPRRVANALCRCLASGRTVAELAADFQARPGAFDGWTRHLVLLERTDEDLRHRVARRTAAMLAAGLVEEVRALREAGLERNPSASSAIGYRETLAHLRGEVSRAELPGLIETHTLQLIRKQRAWFRRQLPPALTVLLSAPESVPAGDCFA